MNKTNSVRFSQKNMSIYFRLSDNYDYDTFRDKLSLYPHYGAMNSIIRMLRGRGWMIEPDPEIAKRFPILSKYHKHGVKGDLHFTIEIHAAVLHFEFYHEFNVTNQNGGRYDSDKWDRAPYLVRLQFIATKNAILKQLAKLMPFDYADVYLDLRGEEFIVALHRSNSFSRNKMTSVQEIPGFMSDYDLSHNNNDRDKQKIICGEIKYYRSESTGRLMRGRAWHNINNMWWVILPGGKVTNEAAWRLFTPTPEDFAVRRFKEKRIPKKRQEELAMLTELSTSDLKRELRLRAKRA